MAAVHGPTGGGPVLRRADELDRGAILGVLEAAFAEDPFVRWLVGGPGRAAARRRYFELMLGHIALPRGRVDVAEVDGRIVAAALWAPPGTWDLGLAESLRVLPIMVEIVGVRRFPRIAGSLDAIEGARPREPRWLLTLVGTAPRWRRRGVGRALLAPVLGRCDRDGTVAALETSVAANLTFYRALGFEVRHRLSLADGGPTAWVMVRYPR
ncbi:MAG: GNAT family N-acetyltransferase [Sandaracinaceae bacterium]